MFELPLFPLNTVLYPGIPVYLHVFEERYQLMMQRCLDQRESFGVTLIKQGVEVGGPAQPHLTGCTAQIIRVQRMEGGRMNIVALGQRRFRIATIAYEQPYLVGMVDAVPVCGNDSAETLATAQRRLLPWIEQYLNVLRQIKDVRYHPDELPDDPALLAYTAAHILHIPQQFKQQLLEIDHTLQLLTTVRDAYRRETALLRVMVAHTEQHADLDEARFFSPN